MPIEKRNGIKNAERLARISKNLRQYGQEHCLDFWEKLSASAQLIFLNQLEALDWTLLTNLQKQIGVKSAQNNTNPEQINFIARPEKGGNTKDWEKARAVGEQVLRAGKAAVFTVAGGQGSRLGWDKPKGSFPASPIQQKSLFQLFAEKISRTSKIYGRDFTWIIMTSRLNDAQTKNFFTHNAFFSLKKENVRFIIQDELPAFSPNGKILLSSAGTLALAPNGHGGAISALAKSGVLDELLDNGVDCLSYFQVDNPLVNCLDPYFLGFHKILESEASSKATQKVDPLEKVGIFAKLNGKIHVLEYSEIDEKTACEFDPLDSSRLKFDAANIGIHVFDVNFLRKVHADKAFQLPWRQAHKKMLCVQKQNNSPTHTEIESIKFERFIFDALPQAENSIVIETLRAEEFSPIKNADGADSPASSKLDQINLHKTWLCAVSGKDIANLPKVVEISPLFAINSTDFAQNWQKLAVKPKLSLDKLYITSE